VEKVIAIVPDNALDVIIASSVMGHLEKPMEAYL
jgi:hypothetical protein